MQLNTLVRVFFDKSKLRSCTWSAGICSTNMRHASEITIFVVCYDIAVWVCGKTYASEALPLFSNAGAHHLCFFPLSKRKVCPLLTAPIPQYTVRRKTIWWRAWALNGFLAHVDDTQATPRTNLSFNCGLWAVVTLFRFSCDMMTLWLRVTWKILHSVSVDKLWATHWARWKEYPPRNVR